MSIYCISAELEISQQNCNVFSLLIVGGKEYLPVVARNGFAEAIGYIHSRSMDQNRMEENGIALLHWQLDNWVIVVSTNTVVHLIDTFLPIRIVVLMKDSFVRSG